MTLQGSSDFMEVSSSLNVINLPGLMAIGIAVVEVMFLIYYVASHDYVFKDLCNFVDGSFS